LLGGNYDGLDPPSQSEFLRCRARLHLPWLQRFGREEESRDEFPPQMHTCPKTESKRATKLKRALLSQGQRRGPFVHLRWHNLQPNVWLLLTACRAPNFTVLGKSGLRHARTECRVEIVYQVAALRAIRDAGISVILAHGRQPHGCPRRLSWLTVVTRKERP
jgi:hypothetical protein